MIIPILDNNCRDFRPASLERNSTVSRLRFYKIYAWGVPLVISGVAATLHHTRKDAVVDTYLHPRFCETEYWFSG